MSDGSKKYYYDERRPQITYYKDKDGKLYRAVDRVWRDDEECLYDWDADQVLYRLKAKTKGGHTEVSASTFFYNQILQKKAFWEKTGYYKKVVIQERHLSAWEDE